MRLLDWPSLTPVSLLRTLRGVELEHANRRWWSRLFRVKYKEKVQRWKLKFQRTLNVRRTTQSTCHAFLRDLPGGVKFKRCVSCI